MATALIQLTTAGADTDSFSLSSNTSGFATNFESGISRASLLAGYTSNLVPAGTTTIRVKSNSASCSNYVDIVVGGLTTTSTTTTTTAVTPNSFLWNDSSYDLTIKFTLWVKNTGGSYAPVYSSPAPVFIESLDVYSFYQGVYPGIYPTNNKGFKLTIDSGSIGINSVFALDPSTFYLTSGLGNTLIKNFNFSSPAATVADDSKTGAGDNVYYIDMHIGSTI
jgi:hypothetical protein